MPITCIGSQFGHRFMSIGCDHEDGSSCEECLTCGARFTLQPRADDPGSGDYIASDGSDPKSCTGDTAMRHGDAPCDSDCAACAEWERCSHQVHDCNCLLCTG